MREAHLSWKCASEVPDKLWPHPPITHTHFDWHGLIKSSLAFTLANKAIEPSHQHKVGRRPLSERSVFIRNTEALTTECLETVCREWWRTARWAHLINYLRTDGYQTRLSIKLFQPNRICIWSSSVLKKKKKKSQGIKGKYCPMCKLENLFIGKHFWTEMQSWGAIQIFILLLFDQHLEKLPHLFDIT